ncbi:MAG: hypothetical protein AAGH19_02055 [Pseudomonadota bacterium]
MKVLFAIILFAAPLLADAEIYRCETPEGVVFSDRECGEAAERVELADDSAGVSMGPPEEVREYLAEQREVRAQERQERIERRASQTPPTPAPIVVEQRVGYPYWWGARPPVLRPPPQRPPVQPPMRPPDVVRPR